MTDAVLGCIRPVLSRNSHNYSLSNLNPSRFHSLVDTLDYEPASMAPMRGSAEFSSSYGAFPQLPGAQVSPRQQLHCTEIPSPTKAAPLGDGACHFTCLPEELLIHILSYVQDPVSLLHAMSTCRILNRVGQDDRCWSFFSVPQKLLHSPYDSWSCYRRCKFYLSFADEHIDLSGKWQAWRLRVKELSPRVASRGRRRKAAAQIFSGSGVSRTERRPSLSR